MDTIAVQFTDRAPRIGRCAVVTVREFEPVKGADAETAAIAAVDTALSTGYLKKASSKRHAARRFGDSRDGRIGRFL
jgi:hypothetical protein